MTKNFRLSRVCSTSLSLVIVIGVVGCDRKQSADSSSQTSGSASVHLLTTEPADPTSLTQAAEELSGSTESADSTSLPQEMVLVGKIEAGDFPAFQDDQATFILSELAAEGHGLDDPDHEDNCPFCKRRAEKAPKAIVNIVGPDGKTLGTDARTLLGLAQGDRVIAVGTATYDKSVNAITLQCSGVYQSR